MHDPTFYYLLKDNFSMRVGSFTSGSHCIEFNISALVLLSVSKRYNINFKGNKIYLSTQHSDSSIFTNVLSLYFYVQQNHRFFLLTLFVRLHRDTAWNKCIFCIICGKCQEYENLPGFPVSKRLTYGCNWQYLVRDHAYMFEPAI